MPNKTNHIVLLRTDADSDKLVIETLFECLDNVLVVDELKQLCKEMVSEEPKVILVTGETLEQCLGSYYRSLDAAAKYELCEHRVVALIPRNEEAEAYKAFRSGVIDDYLVARPLYERHRIVLICEHLLVEMGVNIKSSHADDDFVEGNEKLSAETLSVVKKGLIRKEKMREAFEDSMLEIDIALDKAVDKIKLNQPVNLDLDKLKATLGKIRSDEIRPELIQLQQKAISLLEQIVSDEIEDEEGVEETDVESETNSENQPATEDKNKSKARPAYEFNRLYAQNDKVDDLLNKSVDVPAVLIVEDDPISVQLTRKLFTNYNVQVEFATSGRKAFACLTSRAYNLVFLDVTLPDTNGIYIVNQTTKGSGPNADTPIIMLSGNHHKNTVNDALKNGAKGYIVKPLYKNSLIKAFAKFDIPLKLLGTN